MTTAFAVGDKVEFVQAYWGSRHIEIGETATVTRGGGNADLIYMTLDKDGKTNECYGKRLKLVVPPKFKAGDKVRNTGSGNRDWKGLEGVVIRKSDRITLGKEQWWVKITALNGSITYRSVGEEVEMANIELVEAAPTFATGGKVRELKVGDKVRVTDDGSTDAAWIGAEGIVETLKSPTGGWPYNNKVRLTKPPVDYEVGYLASLSGANLVVIEEVAEFPRPITFEEIQKGDTLRRNITQTTGSTLIVEGVVHELESYGAYDKGFTTTLAQSSEAKGVTLELLARPEPEPVKEPEIWENRKVGEQLYLPKGAGGDGSARVFTKVADNKWTSLFLSSTGSADPGYTRTDKDIAEYLNLRPTRTVKLINAQS